MTGKEQGWIRATTWARSIADSYALMWWQLRRTALGLAHRQDLALQVASVIDPDSKEGKQQLERLINRAQEQAKADERRNLGSALHSFCEAHDSGREVQVPPPFDKDLLAYQYATRTIDISKNYIEQICVVRELGVAGTMDRVVRFKHHPTPMIADIKTGKDLSDQWTEIVIQLALYAHADTVWDEEAKQHHRMLPVDPAAAVVIHLPAGEARCVIYMVDIAAGWEMALECKRIREWRARKDLAEIVADWSVTPEELK